MALVCVVPSVAYAGPSNGLMDISADGTLLACSNRDSGTVTIVDLTTNKTLREFTVGHKPEGVTFVGETHQLAIAVYADDVIMFCDADTAAEIATVDVFDEPYGLVSNKAGTRVYATLDFPGRIVEIDTSKHAIVREFDVGSFLKGLALSADEQTLYASEYYTAVVIGVAVSDGSIVDRWQGASGYNLSRQLTIHPSRSKLYVTHIRSRITTAHGEGSIFPYVTVMDTRPQSEQKSKTATRIKPVPMDAFLGALVTANPWETGISPDGKHLYVVFAGTDDMFACNVIDDDYRELNYRAYLQIGKNPRAVRVSNDGKTVYVYQALDFNIAVIDAATMQVRDTISVCDNPLPDDQWLGKVLFYRAMQPMSGRRWISCSSCHPDGQQDGRVWQNPEGLRDTQPLAGLAWTHPLHWSADRDEVQDFEHTIRGPLMQGQGLLKGTVQPSLEEPNGRLSDALDALAAYTNSHTFSMSPFSKNGLSEGAKRGKDVFFSKETRCAECHSGPLFTDSNPINKLIMHDVGTGGDDPSEQLGPQYDTPTLLGVYRSAPYLHHGKAATLRDVLTTSNTGDKHGKTSQLSEDEISDLIEFLQALPYEDPVSAAIENNLIKVEK
ncbi:MAG: beta-propeller fold lactonase family protein [Planctomycetota bacterium]|nr:beta-propeller fold lactonase family protein [Planctomycetota bacterium]